MLGHNFGLDDGPASDLSNLFCRHLSGSGDGLKNLDSPLFWDSCKSCHLAHIAYFFSASWAKCSENGFGLDQLRRAVSPEVPTLLTILLESGEAGVPEKLPLFDPSEPSGDLLEAFRHRILASFEILKLQEPALRWERL